MRRSGTLDELVSEASVSLGRRVSVERRAAGKHRLHIESSRGQMDYIVDGDANDLKAILTGIEIGAAYTDIGRIRARANRGHAKGSTASAKPALTKPVTTKTKK